MTDTRHIDIEEDGRLWWAEDDHGMWICACGREFMIDTDGYETCPGCGRSYKMEYKALGVLEKLEKGG